MMGNIKQGKGREGGKEIEGKQKGSRKKSKGARPIRRKIFFLYIYLYILAQKLWRKFFSVKIRFRLF